MARLVAARERVRPAMEQNQETTARADWLQGFASGLCGQRQRFWLIVQIGAANFPIQRSRRSRGDAHAQPRESAVIQTAYLIPNGPTLTHLRQFVAQGIDIRILTNSAQSNNHSSVHAYYAPYRQKLLEGGVDLYELQGTGSLAAYLDRAGEDAHAGLHTKAMVIDDRVAVIGSYNMDPRSRVWNSEIALVVENRDFAAEVLAEMARDFAPEAAWRLSLDDARALVWSGVSDGEPVQLQKGPGQQPVGSFSLEHDAHLPPRKRTLMCATGLSESLDSTLYLLAI